MDACKEFSLKIGFASKQVKDLINLSERVGAIGATQNMLGEAVHALVKVDNVNSVYSAFEKFLPEEKIIVSKIDPQGVRIVG
jgi:pantoate kinase